MPIPWAEQLGVLLELQKRDTQIYRLEKYIAEKPADKKALEQAFEMKKGKSKASEQELRALQLKQKERENDLAAKEGNIKKYLAQQSQVKTNQEYSALTKEINGLKADCSIFEEEIITLMDQIELQKKVVEKDKQELAAEEKVLKAELAKVDAEIASKRKEADDLKAERQQFVPQADKQLLAQYERILKKKEGTAVVQLVGETCSGCNVSATPQTIEMIRRREQMMTCECCGRILYEPS